MLSTIKVVGYENNEGILDIGATEGDFYFNRLDELGGTIDTEYYSWLNMLDEEGNWMKGWWVNNDGEIIGATAEEAEMIGAEIGEDILLTQGEAVWFKTIPAGDGEQFKLVFSGSVSAEDSIFPLVDYGNCIANPMPCPVMFSDISVDGYQNNEGILDIGATEGDFYFNRLDELGGTIDTEYYSWLNMLDEEGNWMGGWWVNNDGALIGASEEDGELIGAEVVPDEAIAAGEGLWFKAIKAGEDEQFYLCFGTPVKKN